MTIYIGWPGWEPSFDVGWLGFSSCRERIWSFWADNGGESHRFQKFKLQPPGSHKKKVTSWDFFFFLIPLLIQSGDLFSDLSFCFQPYCSRCMETLKNALFICFLFDWMPYNVSFQVFADTGLEILSFSCLECLRTLDMFGYAFED